MLSSLVRTRTYQPQSRLLEKFHPVLARIYAARGIESPEACDYLLQRLHPAQQLLGMDLAVDRLVAAIKQQEKIMIIGDFDADGATSTALAVSALQAFGCGAVEFLVPNRFEYGYGLTPEIVTLAQQQQPKVIITVDNGISSLEGVACANALGIDVIITDHHLPGDTLPAACAIVNPNQKGCEFPSKVIAGVGVIFYVMCGLRAKLREEGWFAQRHLAEPNMSQFLDLVALGTIADVVPLDYNNRILVDHGLKRIRSGLARLGIQALFTVSARDATRLSVTDLGFALAPRLNAAGRLTDMSIGIALLLSEEWGDAISRAKILDDLNQERRRIEKTMHDQAKLALASLSSFSLENGKSRDQGRSSGQGKQVLDHEQLQYGYCFYQPQWHQGIIGIIAGRLKEQLHRPVIVFANHGENDIKGSARSIAGVHIRDVLESLAKKYPEMLSKFGGHAMAAGLTLEKKYFAEFAKAFNLSVQENCDREQLTRYYISDGELTEQELSLSFAQLLRDSGPWGQGFPEPCFQGKFQLLDQRLVGEKHLKMTLALLEGAQQVEAIAFNIDTALWPNYRAQTIECVYRLDVNTFNGVSRLQLIIEYFQTSHEHVPESVT